MGIVRFFKNLKEVINMEEVEMGASAPKNMTEDEEFSKFLNELREHNTERLKNKWVKHFNNIQEFETAIRSFDEILLMKKTMTPKQKKEMEKLQKELKAEIRKKEAIQKEMRNR